MVVILCECDWGTGVRLPPHLHVQEGLATMPDGREKWVAGLLGQGDEEAPQRHVIDLHVRWTKDELTAFLDHVDQSRGGTPTDGEDRAKFRELREHCRTQAMTVGAPAPDWDRFGDLVQYILTGYWENLPWGVGAAPSDPEANTDEPRDEDATFGPES